MLTEELQYMDSILQHIYEPEPGKARPGSPDRGLTWELGSRLRKFEAARYVPMGLLGSFTTACGYMYFWNESPGAIDPWPSLGAIRQGIAAAIAAPAQPPITRFPTATDHALADALERDLKEAEACADHGHWKSCVVLCGSILEAVLYEYLRRDPAWTMAHMPPNSDISRQIASDALADSWTLQTLIKFVCWNKIVDTKWEDALSLCLREPRNLIHPTAAWRKHAVVDGHSARLSLAALNAMLKELYSRKEPWKP